ncbi:MAG: YfbK domain-containing protein, partial [Chitinophagaceae bacterium]
MKYCLFLFIFLLDVQFADAQFYYRGKITDETGNALPFVQIKPLSNQGVFFSGSNGEFGFPARTRADSVFFRLKGYADTILWVQSDNFSTIVLRNLFPDAVLQKQQVVSFIKDIPLTTIEKTTGGETYSRIVENDFVKADRYPSVGFSMNVDKASYSNIRRYINMEMKVPADAVRIEEMLNYFNQGYVQPSDGNTFYPEWKVTECPWNQESKLLLLRLHAQKIPFDSMPPNHLVFLIDVSGSMEMPNRLGLLKSAFRMLVENLREKDTISVVVYGGGTGVKLYSTSGSEKHKIMQAIDSLEAAGDTPGEAALRLAYRLAEKHFIKGGNNRIILATDGDFNVGEVSEAALAQLVMSKQQTGIYLTCLGVGMGNYKDSKLELLAKRGNGNFAYLDRSSEAERVLVQELTQTLYSVADDARVQIQFNPTLVNNYRLVGYDNMQRKGLDSTEALEGGEIGSGHIITAIFEFTPAISYSMDQ